MEHIEFANKEWLWLLGIIPLMTVLYLARLGSWHSNVRTSQLNSSLPSGWKTSARHGLFVLRMASAALLILALARPQSSLSWENETTEGIDIVISMDISTSMDAKDLKPNRLEAAKSIGVDFIKSRVNDRIGLVVYAGESFTQCPLTTDHDVIINMFEGIKFGMIENGTAIGHGLATAVSRLKDSDAQSKVIILLTDGVNNAGTIPPATAADIAQSFGIRTYCIGIGTKGKVLVGYDHFGREIYDDNLIDEETLTEIAEKTGGAYFRATDNKSLAKIYEQIDLLEKSKIKVTEYQKKDEKYKWLAIGALLALAVEFTLKHTLLKTLT